MKVLILTLMCLAPWSPDEATKIKFLAHYLQEKGYSQQMIDVTIMQYGLDNALQIRQCQYCHEIISVKRVWPFGTIIFGQVCENCLYRGMMDFKRMETERLEVNVNEIYFRGA